MSRAHLLAVGTPGLATLSVHLQLGESSVWGNQATEPGRAADRLLLLRLGGLTEARGWRLDWRQILPGARKST